MPYEIVQDGDNYHVINSETKAVKARHQPPDAKGKAERQVSLLHEIEKNPNWQPQATGDDR